MSLDLFFERACEAWPAAFSDLAWAGNCLVIAFPPEPVVSVRFALQEEECLHLKDMRILQPGPDGTHLPRDPGESVLRLSSCYPGSEDLLAERRFLLGADFIGFHTGFEAAPWAEVTFSEAVAGGVLLLSNRDDAYAARARSLVVSCVLASGRSVTLYDALERLKEAQRWLLQQYLDACGQIDAQFAPCAALFLHMARWETEAASATFLQHAAFLRYRVQLNRIARLYRLEFTIHGLARSFRYWSREEKVQYLEFGKELQQALEGAGAQVCFGFGAVLGFVRSGDFIEHDDDLDLLVAFDKDSMPTISAGLQRVEEHLRAAGYTVEGDFLSHRWVWLQEGQCLDIFVGLIEGEHVSFYPSRRHAYRRDDIFPPEAVAFHEVEVAMPRNIVTYLAKTYGPDWRVPNSAFGHSWDEAAYADIR